MMMEFELFDKCCMCQAESIAPLIFGTVQGVIRLLEEFAKGGYVGVGVYAADPQADT